MPVTDCSASALAPRLALALLVGAVALSGCDAAPAASHELRTKPPDEVTTNKPSTCVGSANLVDQAICPRLLRDGCASASGAALEGELCRRLHLDLIGVAPTPAEAATTCAGKTPREIATALMATPAYVKHAEALWAVNLAYDPAQVDGRWLADADRIVDDLVTGRIAYDTFARRIVGHPVFGVGARLPRSDVIEDDARFYPQVAARATQLFLGRAPIAGEDASLARLFRFWKKNIVVINGDYGRAEAVIDPTGCPCESTALGKTTRIALPLDRATPYEDLVGPDEHGALVPRSPALRAELEKAGALLAAQAPFWTQAADLALAMYLGWWKSTTNLDETMLPELQLALGELLHTSRSWPEVVLAIVTSTLYVRTNRTSEAGIDAPTWCAGPMRVVRPESFVSSLGHLLGVRVGRCDHRTYEPRGIYYPNGSEGSFFPYYLREDEDADALLLGSADFHLTTAGAMGGCNAGAPRTEDPTLTYVFGSAPAAATICGASEAIVPPGMGKHETSEAAVRAVADHVSGLLRGRGASDDEKRALLLDAAPCTSSATCETSTVAALVCTAIARSTDSTTY